MHTRYISGISFGFFLFPSSAHGGSHKTEGRRDGEGGRGGGCTHLMHTCNLKRSGGEGGGGGWIILTGVRKAVVELDKSGPESGPDNLGTGGGHRQGRQS